MANVKILIVLYNRLPMQSETIRSLYKIREQIACSTQLIVWDNSQKPMGKDDINIFSRECYPLSLKYIGNGFNTPLSIVYNTIIQMLADEDLLIIFDHDTNFSIKYFQALLSDLEKYKEVNLFLPIIKYKNEIISPANNWYFKGSYLKKKVLGLVSSKNKTAINSGMAIRASYLKNHFEGYDENLLFYGTDDDFMAKYASQNEYFCVINSVIDHTLDFYEDKSIESKIRRYSNMRGAALYRMRKKGCLMYFLTVIYFFLYSLKLVFLYKNINFLNRK